MTKWVQGVYISIPYFICTLSVAEFGSGLVIAWLTGSFPLLGKRENIPWLILVGLIYGGFVTLIYVPLALIPAVDDIALLYTNPIIASIIGIVVYRDRFGVFLLIGLVFYSLGVLLVAKPEFIFGASDIVWTNRRKLGYILGGVSGVLEGITLNLVRGLRDRVPPATLPLWAYMAQFLYCFPFLFIFPVSPSHEPVKWVAFLPILVAGIFTSTAEFLLCRTCALLPAGHVGVLGSTQLMLAALWGWLIANESVGWYTIIGCVLMMLGVASVGYHTNRWGFQTNLQSAEYFS